MADDRDAEIARLEAENAALRADADRRDRTLAETLEQQAATADVLRVIATSPIQVEAVLDAIAERAARVCGADDAIVHRLENGDMLRRVTHVGPVSLTGLKRMPTGAQTNRIIYRVASINIVGVALFGYCQPPKFSTNHK